MNYKQLKAMLKCCDTKDGARPFYQTPIFAKGYVTATNGYVLVMVDGIDLVGEEGFYRVPTEIIKGSNGSDEVAASQLARFDTATEKRFPVYDFVEAQFNTGGGQETDLIEPRYLKLALDVFNAFGMKPHLYWFGSKLQLSQTASNSMGVYACIAGMKL